MRLNGIYFYYGYAIIGVLLGVFGLTINQLMPTLLPGSILSPSGGKFYIFGIHLKHWLYGSLLFGIGSYQIYNYRHQSQIGIKISSFLVGLGGILVLDELDDICTFITTGAL